jgi:hypothetical protein
MEVVLLLFAERDLQEAYNWVEEHRQGREQYFLQDVHSRLEHLKKFPLIRVAIGTPYPSPVPRGFNPKGKPR